MMAPIVNLRGILHHVFPLVESHGNCCQLCNNLKQTVSWPCGQFLFYICMSFALFWSSGTSPASICEHQQSTNGKLQIFHLLICESDLGSGAIDDRTDLALCVWTTQSSKSLFFSLRRTTEQLQGQNHNLGLELMNNRVLEKSCILQFDNTVCAHLSSFLLAQTYPLISTFIGLHHINSGNVHIVNIVMIKLLEVHCMEICALIGLGLLFMSWSCLSYFWLQCLLNKKPNSFLDSMFWCWAFSADDSHQLFFQTNCFGCCWCCIGNTWG